MFFPMEDTASSWTGGKLKVVWQVLVTYLHLHCNASPFFVFFSWFKVLGFVKYESVVRNIAKQLLIVMNTISIVDTIQCNLLELQI